MRSIRIGAALYCVLLAHGVPGHAESFSWATNLADEPNAFDQALEAGDFHATLAAQERGRGFSGRAERAARAYEHAITLRPEDPRAHYRLAEVIYTFFVANDDERQPDPGKSAKALQHWQRFEELAPLDSRLGDILFKKSLTLTKRANHDSFVAAIRIYDRLLAISGPDSTTPSELAIFLGNKAELHMMVGELEEAISHYQQAIAYGANAWLGYGLAVALDRDGQGIKAREIMGTNIFSDRQMSRLSKDGTFFVPAGEKNYYLALGFEVLGDSKQAIRSYRAFIDSGAHPRFHERARVHIARLARAEAGKRKRRKSNPAKGNEP